MATKTPSTLGDVRTHIALLEQQANDMATRFDYITTRFEKILDRVEHLTLNTTTLIGQHDTQISALQQQVARSEEVFRAGQARVESAVHDSADEMSVAITQVEKSFSEYRVATDARLNSLEKVRWIVIGMGMAIGYAIANLGSIINFFK